MACRSGIRLCAGLGVALLLGLPTAWAKDPPGLPGAAEVAKASALAKEGRLEEAGELLAKAVTSAVRAKSLEGEQLAAEALDEAFDAVEADARPDARGDAAADPRPGRDRARALAAAVLQGLDARRHGVFVSAHALATGLVFDAVAMGDDLHLAEAGAALAAYAATPKAGVAAATFSQLAVGVRAARAGARAEATAALSAAAAELEARGWMLPALHARLEIAALQLGADDPVNALETLKAALDRLPSEPDMPAVQEWLHAVEVRLRGAPPEVFDAFRARTKDLLGSSEGMAGGRGGNGGQGGGGDVSPIGRVLPKWPAGKPFATVRRSVTGWRCDLPFDEVEGVDVPLRTGQRTWEWEGAGVTLFLAGPALALRMLDLTGLRGQPGDRSRASRGWAFYWLAEGETWEAQRNGIEITGQARALTPR